MNISKAFLYSVFASIGVFATCATALATPVAATTGVNVRSGPGTNFQVLDTLGTGENAEAVECVQSGWCRVEYNGPTGWVYSTFLGPRADQGGNPAEPQSSNVGACFYTGQGHTGNKTCTGVGTYNTLGNFDNAIRSYEVFGGAHVNFCVEANMTGACFEGQRSTPTLGPPLDGKASSLSIFSLGGQDNGAGFGQPEQNNNQQNNQQANNQNNNSDDPNCSFGLVVGPDGPTFTLTCGDNPIIVDPNNNGGGNNNGNDPVADAADRFGDNENVLIVGEGQNENEDRPALEREPAQALVDDNGNILEQLGFDGQNDAIGTPGQPDALVDTPVEPLVFGILKPQVFGQIFTPQEEGSDEVRSPIIIAERLNVIGTSEKANLNLADNIADLANTRNGGNDFIIPVNDAKIGLVTNAKPTFQDCSGLEDHQVSSIRRGQVNVGDWFCLRTTNNNRARVKIVSWNRTALQYQYDVWNF